MTRTLTNTTSDTKSHRIPESIARRLAQLTRRAKTVAAAKGAAYTVAAFLLAALAAVAADWFVPMLWPASAMWFTPAARVGISGTVLAVTLVIALRTLVRPLSHRYSLIAAAMTLERVHPELQERISTTVQLMLSKDAPIFRGSDAMIAHVATTAEADSRGVSPRQVIVSRKAQRAWLAAGLAVLAVAGAAFWRPEGFKLYVARFAAPWNDTAQFRRTRVESLTGGRQVPRMEPLVIEATSSGLRASSATLYIDYLGESGIAAGSAAAAPPARTGRGTTATVQAEEVAGQTTFRFPIARVQESFTYRIRANDGVTQSYLVTAVDRPQAVRIDLAYHYPEYARLTDRGEKDALGPVKALQHTAMIVRLTANRTLDTNASFLVIEGHGPNGGPTTAPAARSVPVRASGEEGLTAALQTANGVQRIPLSRISDREYQAGFEVLAPGQYYFELTSGGLAGLLTADRKYPIVPEPDNPPRVKIIQPTGQVTLRANDKLPIGYEASDDFGLSAGQISYSIDGAEWKKAPVDLSGSADAARIKKVRSAATLDLAKLDADLSAALRIDYQVQVADNRPAEFGGPQWAASSRQRILIDAKVGDYQGRLAQSVREAFADTVAQIDKELRAALAEVKSVQKAMARQPLLDAAQGNSTDAAVGHLSKANELALAAAGKTEFSNYELMGGRLKDIAEGHIQPARQLAGESKGLAAQPDPRKDKLSQSEWHIQRALDLLGAVSKEFTDLIKLEAQTDKLLDMAKKEDEIVDQVADEVIDPKDLAKLTREQMDLLAKAREMLKGDKAESADPLFDVAKAAEKTLNEKIDEIVNDQKDLAEQTAAAEQLSDLEKKAKDLAKRQGDLAKQTAGFEKDKAGPLAKAAAPREADKPMAAAAEQIDRHDFAQAAGQQKAATTQLDQAERKTAAQADQIAAEPANSPAEVAKERRAEGQLKSLASQAKDLAERERKIADQTQSAKAAADRATTQAEEAAKTAAAASQPEDARPAVRAAEKKADDAKRQLADLAKRQQSVATEAKNLQKQAAAADPAGKLADKHDAATPAADAAAKLPAEPKPAAESARKAADELNELAKGLDALAKPLAEKAARAEAEQKQAAAARAASAAAAALKQKQDQLADETRKLGDEFTKAEAALADKQLAELTAKQQALADQAAELADNVAKPPSAPDNKNNPQPAQPNPAATKAAAAAQAAAKELADQKLPNAANDQHAAQGQLEALAGELAQQANQQAGVDPARQQLAAAEAAEAGKLAEQQKQLAQQVANLMNKDPLANLPLRQDALRQQTQDLGEAAKMVADFMRDLSPQAGQLAQQAAAQLAEKAPAAQAAAAAAMRQNQLPPARQAEQQAIAAAQKAGEMFSKAADQAAAAAQAAAPGEEAAAEPDPDDPAADGAGEPERSPYDPLAAAAWAEAQAQAALKKAAAAQAAKQDLAQALAQAAAAVAGQQASQQLGQAAKQMARQVASMAATPGDPSSPSQAQPNVPAWASKFGTQGGAPDLRKLNFELGITPAEWNRLPGYIQQEVLQASREKVPQEYRELIKRYFQAISQQAAPKP